jgi:hypothetical protein
VDPGPPHDADAKEAGQPNERQEVRHVVPPTPSERAQRAARPKIRRHPIGRYEINFQYHLWRRRPGVLYRLRRKALMPLRASALDFLAIE